MDLRLEMDLRLPKQRQIKAADRNCPAEWRRIIGKVVAAAFDKELELGREKGCSYLWIILLDPSDSCDLRKSRQGHRIMPQGIFICR